MKNNMTDRLFKVCRILLCLTLSGFGWMNAIAQGTNAGTGTNAVGAALTDHIYLEAGTVLLQPFSLSASTTSPGKFAFKDGGSSFRTMEQLIVQYRTAWDTNDMDNVLLPIDWELRAGYAELGSGSQSSTTTGAGDFFTEGSLGYNIPSFKWSKNSTQGTINLEAFGRAISDSQYSLIHSTYGIALAGVLGDTWYGNSRFKLMAHLGYAQADTPIFIGPNLVGSDSDGNPTFRMRSALDAKVEVHFPISISGSKWGYISAGGNFDQFPGDSGPDQWSFYAAYTISLETLLGKF
jgi:hypothetical protein